LLVATALLATATAVRAEGPWYEGFEGPQPSWRPVRGDAPYQILAHRRVGAEAFTGDGCEHLAISAAPGTAVDVAHEVGRPRVIDELSITVRVKSNRAGLQLLAEVVLPRTTDSKTGRRLTILVRGSNDTAVDRWQQLRIDQVPQRLLRQVRILRSQQAGEIDVREAYVERVLLRVYGGPDATRVWIDDLDVAGYVSAHAGARDRVAVDTVSVSSQPEWVGRDRGPAATLRRFRVEGSVLLVDERPTLPRMIEYRGEPLTLLKRLGFNAVWLAELPSSELLDEAGRLGLWIVCPPPVPFRTNPGDRESESTDRVGRAYENVLAWNLGEKLTAAELERTRRWAEQVRRADGHLRRPLICGPDSELLGFSRSVDPAFLLVGRPVLGTTFELADYGEWLRQRPRLARPGTPVWTSIQTQPAPALREQWRGLGLGEHAPAAFPSDAIRLLTYTAVAAGSRGLLFRSDSPLDAPDRDTQRRAMTLELLNLELSLIEPWAASGSLTAAVRCAEPDATATMLRRDRSRLVIPMWIGAGAQFVPAQPAANSLSLVVRDVPESYKAYLLGPSTLQPIPRERVAGGTRITLDQFGLTSFVLLTQDPLAVSGVSATAIQIGRRAAQLQRDLAAAKLEDDQRAHHQLAAEISGPLEAAGWLDEARRDIQTSDAALAAGDYAKAYRQAQRATAPLRRLERAYWDSIAAGSPSPVSLPTGVTPATLPWHLSLRRRMHGRPAGVDLLEGGDFEDSTALHRLGWRHFQHAPADMYAQAELSPIAAHSGRYGLRLVVRAADENDPPGLIETPPSWFSSPSIDAQPGQLLRVHGWVRVPSPIVGSLDGLMIVDSPSGIALAERIQSVGQWQEFTRYRVADQSGRVSLTFVLSGIGEAWIDDVTIQALPIETEPWE